MSLLGVGCALAGDVSATLTESEAPELTRAKDALEVQLLPSATRKTQALPWQFGSSLRCRKLPIPVWTLKLSEVIDNIYLILQS
jgi:hypothetical protein